MRTVASIKVFGVARLVIRSWWDGIMRAMVLPPSVAVTGACGRIGRVLVEHLAANRYALTLVDRRRGGLEEMAALGAVVELDLAAQPPAGLFDGVEVVVRLAGQARQDASWDTLLADNIEAATASLVRRLERGAGA